MDQFRQIGEVWGSLKALMVLKHEISINQRQCCLLFDVFTLAFETISEEIRQNLKLEDKNTKWKALERPMRELHRIFKEAEFYIRYCSDTKDWWGKAISLHFNKDCIEFHIHNLLCCFPVVIEAIETAAEITGLDHDDMHKRRLVLIKKYDSEWNDLKIFQWMFGKQYLVPREMCHQIDSAEREDRWLLLETTRERQSLSLTKHEQRLVELLLKKLYGSEPSNTSILPGWVLVGATDYYVKRRLESSRGHYKEIHWLGENFALRTFFGEIEPLMGEISLVISLSHPSILQYHCAFYDEEKKEGFLVMELMSKNLGTYIKENCGKLKRVPFSTPVAVDIMLQIARGMEYLHSRKIYHGDLKPSKVLLKARNSSTEGYFQAKVTGFGLTSIKSYTSRVSPSQNGVNQVIWYAPEVLAEQEQMDKTCSSKYTEKADVYSYGMLCFELLTGKVPFEDEHLQGDKMVRNIRAGGRPLFPHPSPKYLSNLTRKCWQTNPNNRPSFSSICRILRYIKKILVINPDHGQPEAPPPLVDYCDIETAYSKKFPGEKSFDLPHVTQIPFEMFSYRLVEREKTSGSSKDKNWDIPNEAALPFGQASICGDERAALMEDLFLERSDRRSVCSEIIQRKNSSITLADQRSVISEIPHRKFFSVDQGSVCSESPWKNFSPIIDGDQSPVWAESTGRKFISTLATDQRSQYSETPEREKNLTKTADRKSVSYEIPESNTLICDRNSAGSETPERKLSSTTATEHRSTTTTADQVSIFPKILGRDPFSSAIEPLEGITTPSRTETNQRSVRVVIPEKKVVLTTGTVQRAVRSKIPERKTFSSKKYNGVKSNKGPGTPKRYLPRSSTPKGYQSPAVSSQSRTPRGYSFSRSSPTKTHKEYSSPRSSPLNPCTRCSKMDRESLLPSVRPS